MNERARRLIQQLRLEAHPEGGYYRELHRSGQVIQRSKVTRSALTTIYYLLVAGERSQWHRVASDEVWHFYEGDVLELSIASSDAQRIGAHRLGPFSADAEPVHVVRSDEWQAARPLGAYTLVGCTVGPGFDFDDFVLARDLPATEAPVRDRLLADEIDVNRRSLT